MNRRSKLLVLPIFLCLLGFFVWASRHRFVDMDEGCYTLAARLVAQHKRPFLDFFYQQAPLLPYAYGVWIKLFGISWFSARRFSATLTTVLGLLVYLQVCRETWKWTAGLIAVILFLSSTYIFAWFPIVKTYSLTAVFLFATYMLISELRGTSVPWKMVVAGVLLGLGIDTRSYVVLLTPVFLLWIFLNAEAKSRNLLSLWFLGGICIGLAPSLYFFLASPRVFLFDNLGFHSIRSNAGLIGNWRNKLGILRYAMFGRADTGFQFTLISVICLVGIFKLRASRRNALLPFIIAVVLGLISILPTPMFTQYFCLCMPFLVVAVVFVVNDYIACMGSLKRRKIAVFAVCALLALFAVSAVDSFRNYFITGDNVIGVDGAGDAPNWTLDAVTQVSRAVDEVAAENEGIVSLWSGYVFASKAASYSGFETDFARDISEKLSPTQRTAYHLIATSDISSFLASQKARIVVIRTPRDVCGRRGEGMPTCDQMLRLAGYIAVRTVGSTSIFVRGPQENDSYGSK